MKVVHRPAADADAQFIVSSWSRAFKPSRSAGMITTEDWADVMHRQIGKVLARPDARTLIACEAEDPDFIYGWIAGDTSSREPVVFFVYVKEPYRSQPDDRGDRRGGGIARGLLKALGVEPAQPFRYTCWTPVLHRVAAKIPHARHDPNFARYPKTTIEEQRPWKR